MILPQCQGAHVGVPVMAQIQRLTALHGEGSAVSGVAKKRAAEPGETGDLKLLLLYVIVTVVMVRFHGELVGGFNPSEKY